MYVHTYKPRGRACHDPRGLLYAKFVKVHKVIIRAKYHSSRPFEFNHKDF